MQRYMQVIWSSVILAGAFLGGMQWGNLNPPSKNTLISPENLVWENIPGLAIISPESASSLPSWNHAIQLPVLSSSEGDVLAEQHSWDFWDEKINEKVIHYHNAYYKYGFDIPASMYYAAFGSSGEALHTVAISKTIPENFSEGIVRVFFYGKKIVPELQNMHGNKFEDPAGKYVYLILWKQYSAKIEANDISNPVVQKIIQTIAIED
jgi:hypothetical protein